MCKKKKKQESFSGLSEETHIASTFAFSLLAMSRINYTDDWRWMLEVGGPHHHDHRFDGVPPTMPCVPHHPVIGHRLVRPFVVMTVQIPWITPVMRTQWEGGKTTWNTWPVVTVVDSIHIFSFWTLPPYFYLSLLIHWITCARVRVKLKNLSITCWTTSLTWWVWYTGCRFQYRRCLADQKYWIWLCLSPSLHQQRRDCEHQPEHPLHSLCTLPNVTDTGPLSKSRVLNKSLIITI